MSLCKGTQLLAAALPLLIMSANTSEGNFVRVKIMCVNVLGEILTCSMSGKVFRQCKENRIIVMQRVMDAIIGRLQSDSIIYTNDIER